MSDSTYTDSRLITLNASNATIVYNGSLLSSCLFSFTNLLKDDLDILYRQISIQNAQIPISYYIVNYTNNTLAYRSGGNPITTIVFDTGNYNATSFITQFTSKIAHIIPTLNKLNGKFSYTAPSTFNFYKTGSTCFKFLGLDS